MMEEMAHFFICCSRWSRIILAGALVSKGRAFLEAAICRDEIVFDAATDRMILSAMKHSGLLSNLLNGDFKHFNRGGKSFSGFVREFVEVVTGLSDDVSAGCGAEDGSHARFLRFASRAVASVFSSDQKF